MDLELYQKLAVADLNRSIKDNEKERMYFTCMGVTEEVGEIIAEVRKPLFKGNYHQRRFDKEGMTKELGDLLWYLTLASKDMGVQIAKKEDEELNRQFNTNREMLEFHIVRLSELAGKFSSGYFKYFYSREEEDKTNVLDTIGKEVHVIDNLAKMFKIRTEDILEENIKKVTFRYHKETDEDERE